MSRQEKTYSLNKKLTALHNLIDTLDEIGEHDSKFYLSVMRAYEVTAWKINNADKAKKG